MGAECETKIQKSSKYHSFYIKIKDIRTKWKWFTSIETVKRQYSSNTKKKPSAPCPLPKRVKTLKRLNFLLQLESLREGSGRTPD